MNVAIDRLDSTFGPIAWGKWATRSPSAYRHVCSCGNVYQLDPHWGVCSHCYTLSPIDLNCGEINQTITVDGAQGSYDPVSGECVSESAALGLSPAKTTTLSRKLVVAFYQALFERILVSRMMTNDWIDDSLSSIISSSGDTEYDVSPLNCIGYTDLCALPDFQYSGELAPLMTAASRKLAGALCGKISDGVFARAFLAAATAYLKDPSSRMGWSYLNKLFPPTQTKEPGGKLPSFGSVLTGGGSWFNGDDFYDQAWRGDDVEAKVAALKTKVLPRFGAGNFDKHFTDSWLADFSMRKNAPHAGLNCLKPANRALIFREVLEAVTGGMFALDRRDMEGIISAFVSETTRTDSGDPSGDFAATCGDSNNDVAYAEALKCHNACTLLSDKMSAVSVGYAATILGSFGQNTVSFGVPDYRYRFKENVVTGGKRVNYVPLLSVFNGYCSIDNPLGYNPMTESLDWSFMACSVSTSARFSTRSSCTIGVGARVGGYGGALPWFGGDVILYPGPDALEDCVWCGLECRCVSIDELLRATCGSCGETTYCDYYWRLRHELPRYGGYNDASFCFSWTCNRCGLPMTTNLECYDYSCAYLTLYPAKSVLTSKLIEFLKDINVYYTLFDSATKLTTCFFGVHQRGFHLDEILPSDLREFIESCERNPALHFLDKSHRKILSLIDAYVKSKSELCIRSLGFEQMKLSRHEGASIPGVIHPTTFPITREMIFQGKNALIDPRLEDELTDEINKDCNIFTCGYWPIAVTFGGRGEITGVEVRDLKTRARRWIYNPERISFTCREYGTTYTGWRVGRMQTTGNHGVWKCKYEPYGLAVEHEIVPATAFGIVRWNYKVMRRV